MKDSEIEFGKLADIIYLENEIDFYVIVYREITFDYHYHAYIVKSNNKNNLVRQKDLPIVHPVLSVKKNNSLLVATRYSVFRIKFTRRKIVEVILLNFPLNLGHKDKLEVI